MEVFWETTSSLGLQDLGFSGNNFTWSNRRVGPDNILVRLDRTLATPQWRVHFSGSRALHLPHLNSDHSHILIFCDQDSTHAGRRGQKKRLFRFEKMWLENDQCTSMVELGWDQNNPLLSLADRTKRCGERLYKWDKEVFGNIPRRIKITRNHLVNLHNKIQSEATIQEMKAYQGELDDLF
ncbi:hypothetical protein ACS0TY_003720 [Phlomoides rotata]